MTARSLRLLTLALLAYCLPLFYALATLQYSFALILTLAPIGIGFAWLAVLHFERFLLVMTALVPLSVSIKDLGNGYGMSFPGELLLAIAALVLGFNFIRSPRIDFRIVLHPVSLLMLVQVVWIAFTTLTSEHTEVSFKFLLSRMAYWLVYYVGMLLLFRDLHKLKTFLWAYTLGLVPVMAYSILHLASVEVSRTYSPEMAEPFFDDHTVFGACIAMLLPLVWILYRNRKEYMQDLAAKKLLPVALSLMALALAFSFSRAAWMSILAAMAFAVVLRLRIPFKAILAFLLVCGMVVYFQQDKLYESFASNENASGEDVLKTAKSITNVSTDDSNKERLNRWACAIEMYKERKWTGFGPGTYERSYGVYQVSQQMTRISTTDGDRGDAHSEYLTALSEQGLTGLLIHLALLATVFGTAMKVAYQASNPMVRKIAAGLLLGFLTYLIHGAVNSFLDLDKAAALIWGMTAVIVGLDLYHSGHREEPPVVSR